MAEIDIIDQTLRDGQQSLWGMRMKVAHLADDRRRHRAGRLPGRRPHRQLDLRVHDAVQPRRPVGRARPVALVDADVAAPRRVAEQLHRQVRPDARLADGAVDPHARQARHRQLLDLRLPLQHGRDGAALPHRRRRRVRGGAGDHVRHQPGAHRRVVRRPGARVRELGHHRRDLLRGRGRHPDARAGQDADAGAGRGGRRRADRDAVPQHDGRGRMQLPDRCRGRRQGPAHRTRADGERPVGAVDRADPREPALGGPHDQGRPRSGPTDQRPHAPRRRAGGTSDRRPQRVQRVPVPPPAPRRHDRHAQGAARAVRHVGPVRGGPRGDRPRAGGPRPSRSRRPRSRS